MQFTFIALSLFVFAVVVFSAPGGYGRNPGGHGGPPNGTYNFTGQPPFGGHEHAENVTFQPDFQGGHGPGNGTRPGGPNGGPDGQGPRNDTRPGGNGGHRP